MERHQADVLEQATRHSRRRRPAHSQWHLLCLAIRCTMARSPRQLWSPYDLQNRFVRWRRAGVWDRIIDALAAVHEAVVQMIDTSIIPVHQHGVCIASNRASRLVALVAG